MGNGHELTSQSFEESAEQVTIRLVFTQPETPNQNAISERFNRSFRMEVLNADLFNTIDKVHEAADQSVIDYNEYRSHESVGNLPQEVFKPRVLNAENSILEIFN